MPERAVRRYRTERLPDPPVVAPKRKLKRLDPPLEKHIQQMIVEFLRMTGWTVWQMYKGSDSGGVVWVTPGIPDLYVFKGPRFVWLEVKRPRLGRLMAKQVQRHAELTASGLPVAVVTSLEDVQAALASL